MNRPAEMFNLLKVLRPDIIKSFIEFAYRYCNPQEREWGIEYSGS